MTIFSPTAMTLERLGSHTLGLEEHGKVMLGFVTMTTSHTFCGCETSVALNNSSLVNGGLKFEAINVLSIICQQLAMILKKFDESMGGAESCRFRRKEEADDVVEPIWVILESLNMEKFLRIIDTGLCKNSVNAVLRSEISDAY